MPFTPLSLICPVLCPACPYAFDYFCSASLFVCICQVPSVLQFFSLSLSHALCLSHSVSASLCYSLYCPFVPRKGWGGASERFSSTFCKFPGSRKMKGGIKPLLSVGVTLTHADLSHHHPWNENDPCMPNIEPFFNYSWKKR